jgi:hypothetical protein
MHKLPGTDWGHFPVSPTAQKQENRQIAGTLQALYRTRTDDPFLTIPPSGVVTRGMESPEPLQAGTLWLLKATACCYVPGPELAIRWP